MIDYALKGMIFKSEEDLLLRSYWFEVTTSEFGEIVTIHDQSKCSLVFHQKHVTTIEGFVMDVNSNPVENAIVELHDTNGNVVANTITGSDGFFYFTDISLGTYIVILYYNEIEYDSGAEVKNDKITLVEFIIQEEF